MNIQDKFKEILLKDLTPTQRDEVLSLQEDYLKARALEEISQIETVKNIISEMAQEVCQIDEMLVGQVVRNNESQLEREHLMAKKKCFLYILNKFSIPDTKWIEEDLQQYDDK